jgi:sugar O-acyltransferase (sialic acid O-acetyltransferase NeuD family)
MDNLIIIGLSNTANHVYSFVTYHKLFNVIGFAVNKEYRNSDTFKGLPVYDLESLNYQELGEYSVFIAMLWNRLNGDRQRLYDYCKEQGFRMANLISPLAVLRSPINGDNCWIHDYVIVQNDSVIESDVAIMAGSLIGPKTKIGAHCFFGAQSVLGGSSTIGERSFVGIKATVFDGTKIGNKCIIGACAAVKRNMPDFSKWATVSDNVVKQYAESEIEEKLMFSRNQR